MPLVTTLLSEFHLLIKITFVHTKFTRLRPQICYTTFLYDKFMRQFNSR
jgi:hypothetical protein